MVYTLQKRFLFLLVCFGPKGLLGGQTVLDVIVYPVTSTTSVTSA